ncbi:plasmid stabilization protein [Martelella sp. FLE1502]
MTKPQLLVRSARARDLARRLAQRERCSIADIVERALEFYAEREVGWDPARQFYARIAGEKDDDFEAIFAAHRKPHAGPEF